MLSIIAQLNDILRQWKDQFLFYEKEKTLLSFTLSVSDQLCFNDMPFCVLSNLQLETSTIHAERIIFQFNHGRKLVIHIGWPEDQAPYVKSVYFGYFFLSPNHNTFHDLKYPDV